MNNTSNIKLTSAEISNLWTQYQSDFLAACVLSYFLDNIEDKSVKEILNSAFTVSSNNIASISNLLTKRDI